MMDGRHKRAYPRYALALEVSVTVEGMAPITCVVRDFCLSGMYLSCGKDQPPLPGEMRKFLQPDAELGVEFIAGNKKRYKINARLARLEQAGMGLRFVNPNDQVLQGLLDLAGQQQTAAQGALQPMDMGHIHGRNDLHLLLKDSIERFTIQVFHGFYEAAVDGLFERAGRAHNNTEQHHMFEAMDVLNKGRTEAFTRLRDALGQNLQRFLAGDAMGPSATRPTASGELALMDTDEFQSWLALTSVVARLESHYDDALFALEKRLSALLGRGLPKDENPLSPVGLCRPFTEVINGFDVAEEARTIIQQAFQQTIMTEAENFYHDVNRLLAAHNILPVVERELTIVKAPSDEGGTAPHQPATMAPAEQTEMAGEGAARGAAAQAGSAPAAGRRMAGGAPLAGGGEAMPGLAVARQLLHLQQSGTTVSVADEACYSNNELLGALSRIDLAMDEIRSRRAAGQSILEKLQESIASMAGAKQVSAAQRDSLQVMDQLLDSVHRDHLAPEQAKPWFAKLEIPLFKTVVADDRLFEQRDHPAAHFLNQLDQVGVAVAQPNTPTGTKLRSEIEQLVEEVKEQSGEPQQVFHEALHRLEDIHGKLRVEYEHNLEQVKTSCDRDYQLEQKRNALLAILDRLLGDQDIPVIIGRILDAGWKNLLLRSYLREGEQGTAFGRYLDVVEQLLAKLKGEPQRLKDKPWPDKTLVELVRRGLQQVPLADDAAEQIVCLLQPQLDMARIDPASIETRHIPSLQSVAEEQRRRALEKRWGVHYGPERWQQAQDSVRSIAEGDVLAMTGADGQSRQHKLAWVAGDQSRYVFVDGEGSKSQDLKLDELAGLLLDGKVTVLEGWDVPLMDRATYSMLQSIHNKLLHQTNHDQLTGLYNRRAFENHLQKVLERSRIDKSKNIFCYIDLDRFNLLNNACGHAAGDTLLNEIAGLLREKTGANAALARMGGDEFGVLFEDFSRTEGMRSARDLQEAIRNHHFRCEDKDFTVTASLGVTELSNQTEGVRQLLVAADTACITAKEGGRDRIEIYHQDNHALADREALVQMVGQINTLMEKDLLELRCQRISPVEPGRETIPHYEVLLRVQDTQGQAVPLERFIHAAEIYNRMTDIDHWVVSQVLSWLERQQKRGRPLPVLSVNLSGCSVNSKPFMDQVAAMLLDSMAPRQHLCFEITETAAIGNLGQASHFVKRIKGLGCRFALDDFGTGMSSYSYLKVLPVDFLKIDGSFVRNMLTEPRDYAVVKSINEIGHAMGKKTVAEYVENDDILLQLREIGVDYAQGYGVQKPVRLDQLD